MANYCDFTMKIIGTKIERDIWIKKMMSYDEENHFYRIFDFDAYDVSDCETEITGYCAWSIESCCRESGYAGKDLLAINSENLTVEIWSQESGCQFQEHYIYKHGECICDECVDWSEYWYDKDEYPDFTVWLKEMQLPDTYSIDDLDDRDCIYLGGFNNYGDWTIEKEECYNG